MDASISFCRAMRAAYHAAWSFFAASGYVVSTSRGISQSSQVVFRIELSCSRNGSSFSCHFSQITSISALLAMDLSVIWGIQDGPLEKGIAPVCRTISRVVRIRVPTASRKAYCFQCPLPWPCLWRRCLLRAAIRRKIGDTVLMPTVRSGIRWNLKDCDIGNGTLATALVAASSLPGIIRHMPPCICNLSLNESCPCLNTQSICVGTMRLLSGLHQR